MIKSQILQGKNGPFSPPAYAFIYRLKGELKKKEQMSWGLWQVELDSQVDNAKFYKTQKYFHNL